MLIRYGMPFVFLLMCGHANAAIMSWSPNSGDFGYWPTGTLQNTYTNVDSSGIDIRFTVTEIGSNILQSGRPNTGFNAGVGSNLFLIAMNGLHAQEALGMSVAYEFFQTGTLTPVGVTLSDLTFVDIDHNTNGHYWREHLDFSVVEFGGATPDGTLAFSDVGANLLLNDTLDIAESKDSGFAGGNPNPGAESLHNRFTVATTTIQKLEYFYTNGEDNPDSQNTGSFGIGTTDFTFAASQRVVPEPATALIWSTLVGLGMIVRRRR